MVLLLIKGVFMRRSGAILAAISSFLLMPYAHSTVADSGANGFTVKIAVHVAAPPSTVFEALTAPAHWWNPQHTYSGDASHLRLEPKAGGCFCETLPSGGSVQHLTVVYVEPGKVLRLRGALGPFQGLGADGALTWVLQAASGGTDLQLTYALGGYQKDGFENGAKAADAMLSEQVSRLKKSLESR